MRMKEEIDFNIWVTQQCLANDLGLPVQNVHNWVRRGKIDVLKHEFIPGVKVFLVNKNTIRVNSQSFTYTKQK